MLSIRIRIVGPLIFCYGAMILPYRATAGDLSRDDEIFGAEPSHPEAPPAPQARPHSDSPQIQAREQIPRSTPSLTFSERAAARLGRDPLQIGGLLYLRFNASISDGDHFSDHPISSPNILDLYVDGRPNDRIRAFVRGRLFWNPSLNQSALNTDDPAATRVSLNELWLKFDIARVVFVTIGQHLVRWGASRLWNPTDVINAARRPVLALFDQRSGVPLAKFHLPLESLGWNFYLLGILDEVDRADNAGIVARAEFVVANAELSLLGAARKGSDPIIGADLSAGLFDLDISAELGIRFPDRADETTLTQTSFGLSYQRAIRCFGDENDSITLGGEYFYNQAGSADFNPLDLISGRQNFFYSGRHYGAAFLLLPTPGKLNTLSFTGSLITNFSDRSLIARLDISLDVLTYLQVQFFAAFHGGSRGELRLGDSVFPEEIRAAARATYRPNDPQRAIPTQIVDLGLWLNVDL